jgi:hypothetical protein
MSVEGHRSVLGRQLPKFFCGNLRIGLRKSYVCAPREEESYGCFSRRVDFEQVLAVGEQSSSSSAMCPSATGQYVQHRERQAEDGVVGPLARSLLPKPAETPTLRRHRGEPGPALPLRHRTRARMSAAQGLRRKSAHWYSRADAGTAKRVLVRRGEFLPIDLVERIPVLF